MQLNLLKDQELELSFHRAVVSERKVLHVVILHIQEVERRKLYLAKEYGSLFTYLTLEMKYSNAAAQRRIDAARLLSAVPEISPKIQSGALNLSQLGDIQKAVKSAESIHQTKVTSEVKAQIIDLVQNQSVVNTQQICAEMLDIPVVQSEKLKAQKDHSKVVQITMTEAQFAKYEKLRDQLAHKHFQTKRTQNIADVLETIFDELLGRLELKPKVKKERKGVPSETGNSVSEVRTDTNNSSVSEVESCASNDSASEIKSSAASSDSTSELTSGASNNSVSEFKNQKLPEISEFEALLRSEHRGSTFDLSRDIPDEDLALRTPTSVSEVSWHALTPKRKKVILKQQGCCQFRNPATGKVCGSTFNLQVDHIHPKWDGGSNDPQNLRVLCRAHNIFRYRHESSMLWDQDFGIAHV
jgi:hypothetical protein